MSGSSGSPPSAWPPPTRRCFRPGSCFCAACANAKVLGSVSMTPMPARDTMPTISVSRYITLIGAGIAPSFWQAQ